MAASVSGADHTLNTPECDVPTVLWAQRKDQAKLHQLHPIQSKFLTLDLRHINDLIVPLAPLVPDITSILTSIPAGHAFFFSIFDQSDIFHVSVDVATQQLLAFEFEGHQYCYTGLIRDLVDSPGCLCTCGPYYTG